MLFLCYHYDLVLTPPIRCSIMGYRRPYACFVLFFFNFEPLYLNLRYWILLKYSCHIYGQEKQPPFHRL